MSGRKHPWGCTCRTHVDRPWRRSEHWPQADVDYLDMWFGRRSDVAIARKLGRSVVGMRLKAKRLGLHKRDVGLTAREVARLLGIPDSKVVVTWIERGLLPSARRGYPVGNHTTWLISEKAVGAFIVEHGQYVDHERVPGDSPFATTVAANRWISLPEVRRRTGRPPHNVVTDEIAVGTVRAARRGAHWFIRLEDLPLVRPLDAEGIADAVFRREHALEIRRNTRKLSGLALTPVEVRARDLRAQRNRHVESAVRVAVVPPADSVAQALARPRLLEVLVACIEHGDEQAAAAALGISVHTIKNHMSELMQLTGARSRAHAAWLLFPKIGSRYRLPGDARLEAVS